MNLIHGSLTEVIKKYSRQAFCSKITESVISAQKSACANRTKNSQALLRYFRDNPLMARKGCKGGALKKRKKRKKQTGKDGKEFDQIDVRKIPALPDEIWLHIFLLVLERGMFPAFHRLRLVCRHWCQLCDDLAVWKHVDLTCGSVPWIACTDQSLKWLSLQQGKFLQEIKLGNWHSLTSEGVKHLAQNSPELRRVDLTGCSRLEPHALYSLTKYCNKLQHVNLTRTSKDLVHVDTVVHLTKTVGKRLTSLILNQVPLYGFDCVMNNICDHCPNLEHLEMDGVCDSIIIFDVKRWQRSLPNMRVLNLSFNWVKEVQVLNPTGDGVGWPKLHRLSLDLNVLWNCRSQFQMDTSLLKRFLCNSSKLQQLDLVGSFEAPACVFLLLDLPNLRGVTMGQLFWADKYNLKDFISKYAAQLERVDFGRCVLPESYMHSAMQALIRAPSHHLRQLSLKSKPVGLQDVVDIVIRNPQLCYIDLEDCHRLPFQWRKTFDTSHKIQRLRNFVKAHQMKEQRTKGKSVECKIIYPQDVKFDREP